MSLSETNLAELALSIKRWGVELGFAEIRITDVDLSHAEAGLQAWLDAGMHGEMDYMASHGMKRARPAELVPGTVRVVSARMDYLPRDTQPDTTGAREAARLADPAAVISVCAAATTTRCCARLQQLADKVKAEIGDFGYRVFTDSAPVMELPLAEKAGLGWRGKHTCCCRAGRSMFFMGEFLVDLPLPVDEPTGAHCGQCSACITACPTQAILGPGKLDARRCISYLTIELKNAIPLELRPLIGNRIYGCDDCQTACPWNKFAQRAVLPDFDERHGLGRRRWWNCSRGPKKNSTARWKAARYAASAMSAGCAIWRWAGQCGSGWRQRRCGDRGGAGARRDIRRTGARACGMGAGPAP
jgi:epoxyqueuosine reductase